MSLAAVRFVFEHAPRHKIQGSELVILLYLGSKSEERSAPFISEASQREIMDVVNFRSTRHVRRIIDRFVDLSYVRVISDGVGHKPSTYAIGFPSPSWWLLHAEGVCTPAREGVCRPSLSNDPSEEN